MISQLLDQIPTPHSFNPDIDRLFQDIRWTAQHFLRSAMLPTTQEEEWRNTDVSPLGETIWSSENAATDLTGITIPEIPEASHGLLLHNGVFLADRSLPATEKLLVLGSLREYTDRVSPLLATHLNRYTDRQEVFSCLNAAALRDVVLVYIPPHYCQQQPIGLCYVTTGEKYLSQPRLLVIAEPYSAVTLVEIHTGSTDRYWSNPVTEIYLSEQSRLRHVILQQEGNQAFHTATTRVVQLAGSTYAQDRIDCGGQLTRHTLYINQQGAGTETHLQGLSLLKGTQLADTHSTIAHHYPQGTSRQLHKCIVGEAGHGVFSGKIQVAKAAQLTDAHQMSRNLLLSPQARVDTKPQLEIVADNVKCAHGATVSQLDREERFYLQSRGIDGIQASNLLTYAFAGEIVQTLPVASLREGLQQYILAQI